MSLHTHKHISAHSLLVLIAARCQQTSLVSFSRLLYSHFTLFTHASAKKWRKLQVASHKKATSDLKKSVASIRAQSLENVIGGGYTGRAGGGSEEHLNGEEASGNEEEGHGSRKCRLHD
jgi:hypothetical protein